MGRKPIDIEKVKRAALEVFWEKGYDGASIRDIAKRAGCSVGLAYNYYETKDEMFDGALDIFFDYYKKDLEAFKKQTVRDPFRALTDLLFYVGRQSINFRNHNVKLHWTVRYALCERSLIVLEPYVKEVLSALEKWNTNIPLPIEYTAHLITYGVCGMMLRENVTGIETRRNNTIKSIRMFMGVQEGDDFVVPEFASAEDFSACVNLYIQNRKYYLGFDIESFENRAARGEIILMKEGKNGTVVGMLAISKESKTIESFVVEKDYYNKGVGVKLLVTALAEFSVGEEVSAKIAITQEEKAKLGFLFATGFKEISFENGIITLSRPVPEKAIDLLPNNSN